MDLKGRTLGVYQIMEEVGRGGMASVYRAYQSSLNRYVAIKVLPPQLAYDEEFVQRFLREAQAAASLSHPNIVVVHDVGEQGGLYYIVMEFLEGQTLKDLIQREGALSPVRAARILEQVAAALDYAHQRGFVHRDIKPANIFVGPDDRVKLTDFGIAKAVSEAEQLTRTGMLVGTPEYMSPEQAAGTPIDHRTDLYALGVVLYQMMTGQVPHRGTTPHSILHAIIYDPPPLPRQLNAAVPPAIEQVILKALAKQPGDRYQRGVDMAAALRAALAGRQVPSSMVVPTPSPKAPTPRPEPSARKPSLPLAGVLLALAAVTILVVIGLIAAALLAGEAQATPVPTQVIVVVSPTSSGGEVIDLTVTPTSDEPTSTPISEPATAEPLPTNTLSPTDMPVSPTDTPVPPTATLAPPTSTPVPPTPTVPPCPFAAQGLFADLWQTYRIQLGCPLYPQVQVIQDAEQAFQAGHMFWRADNDYAYVVFEQGGWAGTYRSFTDKWNEGDPDFSCPATPPPGLVQPKRGFGKVWCELGGASSPTGWALAEEVGRGPGNGDPAVQDFERGMILSDSDGRSTHRAYVFFPDGTFVRVGY
jgi:serine/threonine-protein kinase